MRKWLIAAFVAILVSGGWVGQASAYSGGLFHGKDATLVRTDVGGLTEKTNLVTDGDESTFYTLPAKPSTGSYGLQLRLSTPLDGFKVTGYRLKADPGSTLYIAGHNFNNQVVLNTTTVDRSGNLTVLNNLDLLYIYVGNNGTSAVKIYEFDVFGTVIDNTPPTAPNLTGSAGDASITLNWAQVSGAAGYNVYRGGVKQNSTMLLDNMFQQSGLTNGQTYVYQVTAVKQSGAESVKSNSVSLKPDAPPGAPNKPLGLVATLDGLDAKLDWDANSEPDLAGYNVYQDGGKLNTALVTDTHYTVPGLVNNRTYRFSVTAVNDEGRESLRSNEVALTTPTVLSVNFVPNKDSIIVQFTGGEPPYTVTWPGGSEVVNGSTYRILGLDPNTDYEVTVVDGKGDSVTQVVNTGNLESFLPPIFPSPENIFQLMIDNFGEAGTIAIAIIGAAVALGIVCILGIWGWRLSKRWLSAAK